MRKLKMAKKNKDSNKEKDIIINELSEENHKNSAEKEDTKELSYEERELYQEKYDIKPSHGIRTKYLILSSQRTGSTYITRRLCNVKDKFGMPSEYLNRRAISLMIQRIFPNEIKGKSDKPQGFGIGKYMDGIQKIRTTADGYFGIKAQPHQIMRIANGKAAIAMEFINQFDQVILITRKNKLSQAISLSLAALTGKWSVDDRKDTKLNDKEQSIIYPLVLNNLNQLIKEDQFIMSIGKAFQKPNIHLEYEEIESDSNAAFKRITDFISNNSTEKFEETSAISIPKKIVTELTLELEKNFTDFITGTYKK